MCLFRYLAVYVHPSRLLQANCRCLPHLHIAQYFKKFHSLSIFDFHLPLQVAQLHVGAHLPPLFRLFNLANLISFQVKNHFYLLRKFNFINFLIFTSPRILHKISGIMKCYWALVQLVRSA